MRSPNGQRIKATCGYCGKVVELHPYRVVGFRYCSMSCRAKDNPRPRNRVVKTCQRCGEFFEVIKARENAVYCSKSCASADKISGSKAPWWNGGKIVFDCIVCGKTITRSRGLTGNTYQFCSNACHNVYRQKRVNLKCIACGKEFVQKKSKADHKFCSWGCYIGYVVGENSVHWKGGERGRKFYPKEWNPKFRHMIRERDNYTCAICKKYGDSVHHINYVKMDTTPENCITLCRACHAKTNSNREYWVEYFSNR